MNNPQHQLNRVVAGIVQYKHYDGRIFYIRSPTKKNIFDSQCLYDEVWDDLKYSDIFTVDELLEYCIDQGLWSDQNNDILESLPKEIDNLKLDLYHAYTSFKSRTMSSIRRHLRNQEERFLNLTQKKQLLLQNCKETLCQNVVNNYLLFYSLYDNNDLPISKSYQYENYDLIFLETVNRWFLVNRLSISDIRALARCEEWHRQWIMVKTHPSLDIFGKPVSEFNYEQQLLYIWSICYDNAKESPEPPSDKVINDDDLFDGWNLYMRQKQQKESQNNDVNQKMKQGDKQEVFIVAETKDDVDRINSMNSGRAKRAKRRIFNAVQQSGKINEENLPDSKLTMRTKAVQQYREKMGKQ